jgi:hypothetical protein
LSRIKSSRSSGNDDIFGGDRSRLGWGFSYVSIKNICNLKEVLVSEDNGSVSVKAGNNFLEMRTFNEGIFEFLIVLTSFFWGSAQFSDRGLHHGVFSTD